MNPLKKNASTKLNANFWDAAKDISDHLCTIVRKNGEYPCSQCGKKIEKIACPACGTTLPDSALRCYQCGKTIREWSKSEPPKIMSSEEIEQIHKEYIENMYKHLCPFCGAQLDGEHISTRYWLKGGCSHNGFDVYKCPKCGKNTEKRGIGPPYSKNQ